MNNEPNDDYDDEERECSEKSEHEEWMEDDNARRYREYQSDNTRPY